MENTTSATHIVGGPFNGTPVYAISVESDSGTYIAAIYSNKVLAWNYIELKYYNLLSFYGDHPQRIQLIQIDECGVIIMLDTDFIRLKLDRVRLNPYNKLYNVYYDE